MRLLTRRTALALAPSLAITTRVRAAAPGTDARFAAIEAHTGGRVGVAALDTGTGAVINWRADSRFVMQSTFKWLLAACVIHRAETGGPPLDSAFDIRADAIIPHSDETKPYVGLPLTLHAMCSAMMSTSDNGAANTLLRLVGGPAGLNAYIRSLGDTVTRQDTYEPGPRARDEDLRDTTTPAAMLASMRKVWLGDALSPPGRALLLDWLRANFVGARRLRAGVPHDWVEGDRTGTGDPGVANDVAIFWPQGVRGARKPILVASYQSGSALDLNRLEDAQKEIGRIVADSFG